MCNELCPPNSTQHVVKAGDTFWKLSQAHGVSVQSISDANPGVDPQNLQIGSTLCIPATSATHSPPMRTAPHMQSSPQMEHAACPGGTFSHTIQAGDTFWKLSQAHGVSVQSISDANPGVDPQNLQIGSTLCIPATSATHSPPMRTAPHMQSSPQMEPVACPGGTFSHTIQAGDTFWRLSQTYSVDLQSIIDANPGADPMNLQIGSTVCIPAVPTPYVPPTQHVICPGGTFSHIIQAGDTFWRLSQTYGVELQSIIDANPGVDYMNLQIGSTVCIPLMPTPPITPSPAVPQIETVACPEGTFSHTIQAGDTFWRLSQTYGVDLQSIIDANPGVDYMNLQIGSTVCIPGPSIQPSCPEGTFPYIVMAGDTFWRLSQTYGVDLQSIIDANPGVDYMNLQIGSAICIPVVPTPIAPQAPQIPQIPLTPPAVPTPSAPPKYFAYLVGKCDTIRGIARKFYVSVDSILLINPGLDPKCLVAGTIIYVPLNCCGPNAFRYAAMPGDTLESIANRFNVCPLDLMAANPNIDFNCLVRCQIICIPSA